eukprot:CAMPEP_0181528554 /NCGR_PEP_ID=MMETSP1110-20121109/70597_1 /TAXON_ID=174948 /ORGANISM="Symbiodinium sp., Strain CCMP421" /LENGTH=93 /DNA_ID=CAMNT_0023659501 /DNA_START=20 /DNA_END=297 /DNA_ORIENTATION=+
MVRESNTALIADSRAKGTRQFDPRVDTAASALAAAHLPKLVLEEEHPKDAREEVVGCTQGIALAPPAQGGDPDAQHAEACELELLSRVLAELL